MPDAPPDTAAPSVEREYKTWCPRGHRGYLKLRGTADIETVRCPTCDEPAEAKVMT